MAQIPFILLTADGGHADVRPGPNLGADDYLVKPVEVADLPKAIVARPERTPPPAGFNADYRFAASAGTRHRRGGAGLRAHLDTAPEAPLSDPASIENPPETRRIGDRRSVFAAKSGAVSRCAQDFCFFIFILDLLVVIIESLFSNPKQKQESNPWR